MCVRQEKEKESCMNGIYGAFLGLPTYALTLLPNILPHIHTHTLHTPFQKKTPRSLKHGFEPSDLGWIWDFAFDLE